MFSSGMQAYFFKTCLHTFLQDATLRLNRLRHCLLLLPLFRMFVKSEEKAEEDTNRKENAGHAVPGELPTLMQIANHPGENIGKADAIGCSGQ